MALSPCDPNSFARPDLAVVTHIHLELNVNFDKKNLSGKCILDVDRKQDTNELILDNRGLVIHSISNASDGSPLRFNIHKGVEYGCKLSINFPNIEETIENKKFKFEIHYETTPESTALQWLTKEQTAGGMHPYLFSQCQAIHARSMLPCQDTPSVKTTYSAKISAPQNLRVIMSALFDGVSPNEDLTKTYTFHQPIPIPSYLIAIAVGALESKKVGPRTTVWAEKEFIERGAYEFAETETMLQVAEEICGPYVWGVYDILILPPSFPFGGMENPCLTFVTPTLLAGDRSLATVIAHEIAHSWTGNLVTNANFEHFWLNEGFTMFIERKIHGRMFGENSREFQALLGLQSLREGIKTLGENNRLTDLVTNLTGVDPDDAFSIIPYEKGHTFAFYLEQLLGGQKEFEPFLRSYFDHFKFKSIETNDWKKYLYDYFQGKTEILNTVDWDSWLFKPGMPPVIPDYDTSLASACAELATKWLNWDVKSTSPFKKSDLEKLCVNQKTAFLTDLQASTIILPLPKITAMQELYDIDSIKNCEIRYIWLRLCIKSRWAAKVSEALTFATEQGRMKYVRPIFRDLYDWIEMRQITIETYLKNRNKMMYVTAHMLAKDLHLDT